MTLTQTTLDEHAGTSECIDPDCIVYIAGPMRGREKLNFPAFDHAAERLRGAGCRVVSPAEIDRAHGIDPERPETVPADFDGHLRVILARDLNAILEQCAAVALLDGWNLSSGSRAEVALGLALGLQFFEFGICDATRGPFRVRTRVVALKLAFGFNLAAYTRDGYLGPDAPAPIPATPPMPELPDLDAWLWDIRPVVSDVPERYRQIAARYRDLLPATAKLWTRYVHQEKILATYKTAYESALRDRDEARYRAEKIGNP
jgi:hypothetical protein